MSEMEIHRRALVLGMIGYMEIRHQSAVEKILNVFKCKRCGAGCCREIPVMVTPLEVKLLARNFGLSMEHFRCVCSPRQRLERRLKS